MMLYRIVNIFKFENTTISPLIQQILLNIYLTTSIILKLIVVMILVNIFIFQCKPSLFINLCMLLLAGLSVLRSIVIYNKYLNIF